VRYGKVAIDNTKPEISLTGQDIATVTVDCLGLIKVMYEVSIGVKIDDLE